MKAFNLAGRYVEEIIAIQAPVDGISDKNLIAQAIKAAVSNKISIPKDNEAASRNFDSDLRSNLAL